MANLDSLYQAVLSGNLQDTIEITNEAVAENIAPDNIINQYMVPAMNEIGRRFEEGDAFVPELLMSARAMKGALEILKPLMSGESATSLGKVVIGTVKGDLHDIGKNLVASMLEGCGFEVINLGIDVPDEVFVSAVKEHSPQIVCMSTLLTTTMNQMQSVIEALKNAGIREQVKVMVGGAPVSEQFALQIGADGFSSNANSAVYKAKELLNCV
ncbi:corrinoid protein of di/trimethylamine methyltransferase [Parabacteroides sp. PF5-5]|uniref:corrinoid protein n=1 Tax=unclassified Parabacteroides TaxID=2649774 RepID=UPI002476F388|nr:MULTISPECIES: corrinoid protein [unclassified Parabacteroides]MDH6305438.1 corrinoid protein of di/trimethylamine methyltransferase [Parabacteroides sp. PH5-39]MDH6316148.1 corrinoid protein of di/trimethylamine methyltransferase [Parabacteroides sp. PF5-13]MDH6320298.1 corrinoid protein of di/trimethylamine methyltransferase [Parabacteroides sp. PH5-13]MDH6324028.1 corrinoid protein of di/trimethylamine methyltransferase [Parabacteroides sp. PH5-8]MDH6327339.1 corrinoid protein of di/trime